MSFQSTPSGGKATRHLLDAARDLDVSIHAFRGEGDAAAHNDHSMRSVSIHAFRGEGDLCNLCPRRIHIVSIHAFRGEGDPSHGMSGTHRRRFNPRLPGGRRLGDGQIAHGHG